MARIMLFAALLLGAAVYAADFTILVSEAKAADKQKDYASAVDKYAQAAQVAENSPQKYQAYAGQMEALWKSNRNQEALELLETATEDRMLKGADLRRFVNLAAGHELWGNHPERCREWLLANLNVTCAVGDNAYFETYNLLAHYYLSRKDMPERAIILMGYMIDTPRHHPAHYYTGWMVIGNAQKKMGHLSEALESYKKAKDCMKNVPYKMSPAEIDKRIQDVEEALKKQ